MPSPEQETANAFRTCLLIFATHTSVPDPTIAHALWQQFRKALLLFGSESDDNIECVERLEVGRTSSETGRIGFGLKLRGTDIGLANVLWHAEGSPMPEQVGIRFPELSQAQWEACQRMATLVFTALESTVASDLREPDNGTSGETNIK